MGMDCIGKNGGSMHANWTGWDYLRSLLVALEEDVTQMAGLNDGDLVSPTTAESWGRAILKALSKNHIDEIRVPSNYVTSNYYAIPHVKDEQMSIQDIVEFDPRYQMYAGRDGEKLGPSEDAVVVSLENESMRWLLEWAEFFMDSGGFEQW